MPLTRLTPMIWTWDMPGTIAFYRELLGFQCAGGSAEIGWAYLERDGVAVMLSAPSCHTGDTQPAFTGSLYFRCDDVDALWQSLRDRVRVCYPLEEFDYGMREFGIYDNNGYLLQFGQPV